MMNATKSNGAADLLQTLAMARIKAKWNPGNLTLRQRVEMLETRYNQLHSPKERVRTLRQIRQLKGI